MSRSLERVRALRTRLGAEIKHAFDAACAVQAPAGSSAAWDACCVRWSVPRSTGDELEELRAALHPERGAPIPELRAVLAEAARSVRVEAKRIDPDLDDAKAVGEHRRLLRLTEEVVEEIVALYREAVLPPPPGMLGNVFARLGEPSGSAKTARWGTRLRCFTCGAPRMRTEDFRCAFCGRELVRPDER